MLQDVSVFVQMGSPSSPILPLLPFPQTLFGPAFTTQSSHCWRKSLLEWVMRGQEGPIPPGGTATGWEAMQGLRQGPEESKGRIQALWEYLRDVRRAGSFHIPTMWPSHLHPRAVSPATIRVKSNPFFTDFRWTWLGRVAKPTYCFSWSCGAERDGSRSGCATPAA